MTESNQDETIATTPAQKRALLISTYSNTRDQLNSQEYINELERLAETYGIQTVQKICCHIREYSASTYLSKGKLEECVEIAHAEKVDVVIFDDEILPSQQRNLEKIFALPVIDRIEIILSVFSQRAQTKEAQLQIELAQVEYQFPRLKRLWTHLSRQSSGGGYVKGEGEKQLEIDKRLLRKRMHDLREELEVVRKNRNIQRVARTKAGIPIFAIIGYTNAGKSTLMHALTKAEVLIEDKLFATLDTTTRKFTLPHNQNILLIDTVGFIRKLPHLLVDAFKSTLEESVQADILLHLIDGSHPHAEKQAEATYAVLKQLHADKKPIITIINKIDQAQDQEVIARLQLKYAHSITLSALTGFGFDALLHQMSEMIANQRKTMLLCIAQKDYAQVSLLLRHGNVLEQIYEDNDIILKVDVPVELVDALLPYQHTVETKDLPSTAPNSF